MWDTPLPLNSDRVIQSRHTPMKAEEGVLQWGLEAQADHTSIDVHLSLKTVYCMYVYCPSDKRFEREARSIGLRSPSCDSLIGWD